MSARLTRKDLRKEAERLDATYFTGNVFTYENILEAMQAYFNSNKDTYQMEIVPHSGYEYIKQLEKTYSPVRIEVKQLAYCVGIYGNSGQLHQIDIYKSYYKKEVLTATVYTYYC